jgi:hypothetical protein
MTGSADHRPAVIQGVGLLIVADRRLVELVNNGQRQTPPETARQPHQIIIAYGH